MIEYLILLLAIPIGLALAKLTLHEKEIYRRKQYFPAILIFLLVLTIGTLDYDKQLSITLAFILITIFVWNKA